MQMRPIDLTDRPAPPFSLDDAQGTQRTLASWLGTWLVLYFYPRANTPGCTREGVEFTSVLPDFTALGATVVGISPDTPKTLCNFAAKHSLGVTLLSDRDRSVAEPYGVLQMKRLYGKESLGIVRTTLLVDPEGVVRHVWSPVKLEGHAEDVLSTLADLVQR